MVLIASLLFNGCQPADGDGGLEEAELLLKILDFGEAERRLVDVRPTYPVGSDEWTRATYGLMLALWHATPPSEENLLQAEALGQELLAESEVAGQLKSRVRLDLARMREIQDYLGDAKDVPGARELYREVLETEDDQILRYQAVLRLTNTYRKASDPVARETGIELLSNFLNESPTIEHWSTIAWQTLGDLYKGREDGLAEALDAYEVARTLGFVNPNQEDIYHWRMANWAQEIGQPERALSYLNTIVAEMPQSTYQSLARQRIIELGGTPPPRSWLQGGGSSE